jgi:membrane protein YqaA with SNARE-associated domain
MLDTCRVVADGVPFVEGGPMRALFYSLLGYFLTPVGVLLLAALDSSLIFFLPLGIDVVLIIMCARHRDLFWLYALLSTIGSVGGAAGTFWLGRKIGEHGLAKLVKPSRLKKIQDRISHGAAVSIAALAIIPPPFPFTAFLLTSGACRVNATTFFVTLAGVRLVRFGVEGWLASYYGRGILTWMKSPTFTAVITGLIVLAIIGTIVSAVAVYRSTRRPSPRAAVRS